MSRAGDLDVLENKMRYKTGRVRTPDFTVNRCDNILTSWQFKFAKIEASFKKAAAKYCQINTPYTV